MSDELYNAKWNEPVPAKLFAEVVTLIEDDSQPQNFRSALRNWVLGNVAHHFNK